MILIGEAALVVPGHGAGQTVHAAHVGHVVHDGQFEHGGHTGRQFCNPTRLANAPNNLPVAGLEFTIKMNMLL